MSVLQEYAKVRQALAKLQEKRRELEDQVADELVPLEGTLKTRYGTIYTSARTYWSYQTEVRKQTTSLKNQISEIQQLAKESGQAESEDRISVGFRLKGGDK